MSENGTKISWQSQIILLASIEQARDGQEAVDQLCAGLVVQGVICDIERPRDRI